MNPSILAGHWNLVSWTHMNTADNSLYCPFGKIPKGYITFENGRFKSEATKDSDCSETHHDIQDAIYHHELESLCLSGSYSVEGDTLKLNYDDSNLPELQHTSRERQFWFDGHRTLILLGEREIDGKTFSIRGTFIKSE